ncbi:lipase family protein [Haloplasma contractile]|uniref:Phospholipase A1 protein n=1 Tax=Haloplasma contractile SSD-17B TaxID=1033810 RepID=U2FMT3_9MOLU|nr:lipase family protein [Haloplasma contractile]ERJ12454.1 phospholipase A1 protein [Haloplasma contractile SSD-17B]
MKFKQLYKEEYSDVVKVKEEDQNKSRGLKTLVLKIFLFLKSIYFKVKFNYKFRVTDYECWVFSKVAYSNIGTNLEFINKELQYKWEIYDFFSAEDGLQFYTFKSRVNKTLVIGFRGTDEWKDWITNINLILGNASQYETAKEHLNKLFQQYKDYKIYFCGHSLGGALSQKLFVYYYCLSEYKLGQAVTFNSAGVRLKDELSYHDLRITNYVIERDLVGASTGNHYGKTVIISPKERVKSFNPLKIYTHTLDQFRFDEHGDIIIIEEQIVESNTNFEEIEEDKEKAN